MEQVKNKEEEITPEFQRAVFKAFWCCMTGIIISKNIYYGSVMLGTIVLYLLLSNN